MRPKIPETGRPGQSHAHPPMRHTEEHKGDGNGAGSIKEEAAGTRNSDISTTAPTQGVGSGEVQRTGRNGVGGASWRPRTQSDNPPHELGEELPALALSGTISSSLENTGFDSSTMASMKLELRVAHVLNNIQRYVYRRGEGGTQELWGDVEEAITPRDELFTVRTQRIPLSHAQQKASTCLTLNSPRTTARGRSHSILLRALPAFDFTTSAPHVRLLSEVSGDSDRELSSALQPSSPIRYRQPLLDPGKPPKDDSINRVPLSQGFDDNSQDVASIGFSLVSGEGLPIPNQESTKRLGKIPQKSQPMSPRISQLNRSVASATTDVSELPADSNIDSGPGGPPLRNVTNTSGPSTTQRSVGANSRLPANKPGSGSGWGNASFMQSQARDNSAAGQMDTYAQTVNGQQQQSRTLNFSSEEYPSLGEGSSQLQSQLPGTSSVWGSRPIQQNQNQRQQIQGAGSEQPTTRQRPSDREGPFGANPGQTQILSRHQQTGGSLGDATRRSSTMQSDGYQTTGFGPRVPPGIDGPRSMMDGRDMDRLTSPGSAGGVSSSRSPISQVMNGAFGQDRTAGAAPGLSSIGQRVGLSHDAFAGRPNISSPTTSEQQADQSLEEALSNMSEKERWGLPGFLAAYQDPHANRLMRGQDLSSLGLRMEQSEPLHQRFLGPFASDRAVPRPLESDYTLPACYTVQNVVPLQQRINGFTEETLFYIFYTMPRDITQELVAEELMGRKWRFHLREKMWLTRDENAPAPVEIEPGVSESGTYLWWNPTQWRRERRQYLLRYDELDDHLQRGGAVNPSVNTSGVNGGVAGSFNAVPGLERMAAGMGRNF